ncbi:MAG: EamA family transporter [Anaerolineales bacterium]|nr:EamA family transporter [Anaerolineales bacterium]
MTTFSLLAILGSACIHVVAHVVLRRARSRMAAVWWVLFFSGVIFLPVAVGMWRPISWPAWGMMGISAVFEAGYFYAIARAYSFETISIVYPLARGTAPIFLLLWAGLGLKEPIQAGGAAGVFTIALGLYVINLPHWRAWREPLRALARPGSRWALGAGLCISLYSFVDRLGIELLEPFLYTYMALWLTWGLLTPLIWREVGKQALLEAFHTSKWALMLAGLTTTAAYTIVLYVIIRGTPASYAGAVREFSVVLGVLVGMFFLKEEGSGMRIVGAMIVAGGVAIIKFLG